MFNRIKNQTNIIFKSMFLQQFTATERYEFLQLCHRRRYKEGEHIYYQNDAGTGMYFIEEGCVELYVENKLDKSDDGSLSFKLEAPDHFGALSIGYDLRRLSSAKCITDCILLGFFKPDFETLKKRNPDIAVKFMESVSKLSLRQLEKTIRELEKATSTKQAFEIQFQSYYQYKFNGSESES